MKKLSTAIMFILAAQILIGSSAQAQLAAKALNYMDDLHAIWAKEAAQLNRKGQLINSSAKSGYSEGAAARAQNPSLGTQEFKQSDAYRALLSENRALSIRADRLKAEIDSLDSRYVTDAQRLAYQDARAAAENSLNRLRGFQTDWLTYQAGKIDPELLKTFGFVGTTTGIALGGSMILTQGTIGTPVQPSKGATNERIKADTNSASAARKEIPQVAAGAE